MREVEIEERGRDKEDGIAIVNEQCTKNMKEFIGSKSFNK